MQQEQEFQQEQAYTAKVQEMMLAIIKQADLISDSHSESIRAIIADAWEELRVRPTQLSVQDLEQLSVEIDRFAARREFTLEMAQRYRRMLMNPFFARVDFIEAGAEEIEKIVIGLYSLEDEKGHLLVDCDYGDQEGHVFTELSNDREWIAFYNDPNQRDGHSFVAKMCFPKDLDGVAEKDVKKVRKDLRDLAKKARFCFNYNGQAPTMATNCNIPVDFATEIYNNYFKRFNGIASYFKVQKRDMWNRGYILISKITGLRAYIYDYPILKGIERRKNGMEDFWDIYKAARDSGRVISEIPPSVMQEIAKRFAQGVPIEEIAVRYSYKVKKAGKVEERFIDINRETVYVSVMKHLWKRKSASDNQSCNYPSQGTAAAMTKIAGIRYFNHLVNDGLIFKVLIPNDVHDEYLIEPPEEIAEQEAKKLSECMEYAAAIFCKKVTIKAVPEIAPCWVH